MSRTLTIPVSDATFSKLQRRAKDIGGGCKAEDVAQDWIETRGRETRDLAIKFADAGKTVDQLMKSGELP